MIFFAFAVQHHLGTLQILSIATILSFSILGHMHITYIHHLNHHIHDNTPLPEPLSLSYLIITHNNQKQHSSFMFPLVHCTLLPFPLGSPPTSQCHRPHDIKIKYIYMYHTAVAITLILACR